METLNRYYIIGVSAKEPRAYEVLLDRDTINGKNHKHNYALQVMSLDGLKKYFGGKKFYGNFEIAGNNLKMIEGSLDRYTIKNGSSVVVILNELRSNDTDECIGYSVIRFNGKQTQVTRITLQNIKNYCLKSKMAGNNVPIANGQYVQTTKDGKGNTKVDHIRSYRPEGYPVEHLNVNVKNANAHKADISHNKTASGVQKFKELFTQEQLKELVDAKRNNVNIKIIANPKLSAEQMHIIWTTEAEKLPGRKFASHLYSVEQMEFLKSELEDGFEIDFMLNPLYNTEQMTQLSLAHDYNIDLKVIGNPENTAEAMEKMISNLLDITWNKKEDVKIKKF